MGAFCQGPRLAAFRAPEMALKPTDLRKSPLPEQATASSPTLFPSFPQLPPELRLKIWTLNLPTTRLVSMRCGARCPSLHDAQLCTTSMSFMGCTSNASVPINLHVCAESRADTLKSFRRAFGFARMPGQMFFNPASDILYFGPQDGYMAADAQFHTCMSMCDPSQLASVRRIAISDALFWVEGSYNSMTAASLTVEVLRQLSLRMPALEQVIFVPREQDEATKPILTEERMARQIQMAMRTVCQQTPCWRPPPWVIVSLRTLSAACG
ncbi:hypothetical protein C2857_001329 [Epichloe festucae Fl1]|uniref:2EXR domain-containing protein n=1 Tax=Epichloe festucae (strain Fl1) TaxID=877507 RepID=A0A7U3Q1N3_EPIFF|nr:hypothetical protein C2857_001329 [Epichloe festucae Fl1]